MSKFAEKLQHVHRGPIATMGFRRSGEEEIPQMLVVASLADVGAKAAKAVASADAVIIDSQDLSAEDLKQLMSALGDVPAGVLLDSTKPGEAAKALEAGLDFVVIDIKTPVEAVNKEGLGRILKIEPSLDVVLARAINSLPLSIDGVLIASDDSVLTIERLLVCRRFADLLDKPLLLTMGSSVGSSDLSSLCEAGVKGIVVPAGLTAKALGELRKAISCLPKPTKHKTKASPIIPRIAPEPEAVVEEEDDDEE
ncbi:MAG: hypothetical protein FJZ83_05315 [Chloroflexi bacterium]|nr:hypothetical protein [Chloroflexota bacterium]MBM3183438.1 hypothetical protein [Chloroflexota bacterium]MBM4452568.1 hypothetical protein [Chloroflexota bacterium]MBM4454278.1 hypothetical protein [Chloroflexota bacterium]